MPELLHGDDAIGLYFDLKPLEVVDLEVAAKAAIEWARAVKAASTAVDPSFEYRVGLIAAEPGSSRWLARIERSPINQIAKDFVSGWQALPVVMRVAIGLAVVIPTTAVPTAKYWLGDDGFSDTQKAELREMLAEARADPEVIVHRKAMYSEAQKDPKIIAIGGGAADEVDWKPEFMLPSSQFPEVAGLFDLDTQETVEERTIRKTMDVVLVTPRLENAKRAWVFRQEGLPGSFSAVMADPEFLAALDSSAIQERLRLNIPMRIVLEVIESKEDGEWKVKRRGRSVVKVLSPTPDPS